jgi:ribosomal protein S6
MTTKSPIPATSYEILFILAGSLRDSETKKELEKWESELSKLGKILAKSEWGRRELAYKITGETTGTYFVAHFEADGTKIAELENALRLDPKIIRHLIVKTPKNFEWVEYVGEDLEHDFTKLESVIAAKEEKRATNARRGAPTRERAKTKPAEKKVEPKADSGAIDKKLDDILADL